jgi:HPt (histidine-containing phosphotransfer) domain-containing protein
MGRPIDFAHLERQTMGDKALEATVLQLFSRQARSCLAEIGSGEPDKIKASAHLLKGAAGAVGAVRVMHAAAACEARPRDAAALADACAAVVEVENYILGLMR